MPTGPLSGVRVIDLTTIYSGPISTAILGDQGADVIKIEAAAGDPMRQGPTRRNGVTASFAMMNRNKRSIVVDIRTDAGRDILFDLVRGADVLVENFRPGVMDRLGVGYDDLRAVIRGWFSPQSMVLVPPALTPDDVFMTLSFRLSPVLLIYMQRITASRP